MSKPANKSRDAKLVDLQDRIHEAVAQGAQLIIRGNNTKADIYPRAPAGRARDLLLDYAGIVSYQAAELVLTVKASTQIDEIAAVLAEKKQMLGFEPPAFGGVATIGGTVATALSGPARPYAGSIRDAVLGVKMLTGAGDVVRFGGEVMKNVAGYDVSRLVVGSMGSLGAILEVSLRVTPQLPACAYWALACDESEALQRMASLQKRSLPISGLAYDGEILHLRLAGSSIAVAEAASALGDFITEDGGFWGLLNEQQLPFFTTPENLWRIDLPFEPANAAAFPGTVLWDWGGRLCWLKTNEASTAIRELVASKHGSARLYKGRNDDAGAEAVSTPISEVRARLRTVFDPHGVFCGAGPWISA